MVEFNIQLAELILYLSSGAFALASVVIAAVQIYVHLRNWTSPVQQRLIVRMLLMCPVYAVNSWLGIFMKEYAVYVNTLRACYESFVIHTFFTYLMEISGGREELVEYLTKLPVQKHLTPLCCFTYQPGVYVCLLRRLGERWRSFLRRCRQGTLQYVYINVIATLIGLVLNFFGLFDEGNFRVDRAYLYVTIANNASVLVSMYCLLLFYTVTKEKLAPHKPLLKFFVVKAVVFFSFWQSVAVAVGAKFEIITAIDHWTVEEVSAAIQDFLICIEMFVAAILFHKAFPYTVYKAEQPTSVLDSVKNAMAISDVAAESVELFVPRDRHHELPLAVRRQLAARGGPVFDEEFSTPDHRPLRVYELRPEEAEAAAAAAALVASYTGPTAVTQAAAAGDRSAIELLKAASAARVARGRPVIRKAGPQAAAAAAVGAFAPSGGGFAEDAMFQSPAGDGAAAGGGVGTPRPSFSFSPSGVVFSLPEVQDGTAGAAADPMAPAPVPATLPTARRDAAERGEGSGTAAAAAADDDFDALPAPRHLSAQSAMPTVPSGSDLAGQARGTTPSPSSPAAAPSPVAADASSTAGASVASLAAAAAPEPSLHLREAASLAARAEPDDAGPAAAATLQEPSSTSALLDSDEGALEGEAQADSVPPVVESAGGSGGGRRPRKGRRRKGRQTVPSDDEA